MNEEPSFSPRERHVWAGKFLSRLQRYRNLVLRRWWVPAVCVLLALAAEGAHIWTSPAEYYSLGQMIVNIKLNIQQNSLYTEMQSYESFLGTQAALMQGDEVLHHAQDRVANENPNVAPARVFGRGFNFAAKQPFSCFAPPAKIRNTRNCFSRHAWRNTST